MKNVKNVGCGCIILFFIAVAGLIWLGNHSHQPSSSSNSAPPPTKWEIEAANRQRQSNIAKQKRDAEIEEQKKAKIEAKKRQDEAIHPKQSTDTSLDFQKIEAWVFTQYLVEEHLKAPKSAKFPFGGAQNHVEKSAPGIFIIRSYVDSQNSFGAMIRTKFFCKLQAKNGKFEVLQLTFD